MAAVAGTDDTFVVDVESVSLVPNGLEYSRTDRSWRRSATGTDFDTVLLANGSVGKVPRPLCFPGDEKLGVAPQIGDVAPSLSPDARPAAGGSSGQASSAGGLAIGSPPPRPNLATARPLA